MARLSPQRWAQIIVAEARAQHIQITPRQVAEGIGVIQAESGGDPASNVPGNEHKGAWAESTAFGTLKQRLDPFASTAAALKSWAGSGKSWWPAWGRWEQEQSGTAGESNFPKYLGVATAALGGKGIAAPGTGAASSAPSTAAPSSGGSSSDLMHIALVAILVLGGIALVGFGAVKVVKGPAA